MQKLCKQHNIPWLITDILLVFCVQDRMYKLRNAIRRVKAPPRVNNFSPLSRRYSTLPRLCPSCSAPLATALPTCTNCSHIEPIPESASYFDILGLSDLNNRFRLDAKDLRFRFLQAQRICHPDAWSGKGQVRVV